MRRIQFSVLNVTDDALDRRVAVRRVRSRLVRALDRGREPSLTMGAAAVGTFVLADWGYQQAGDSLFPGGPLDETAHLMTAFFFLWALGRRVPASFFGAALSASVLIDADHIPDRLGVDWLTAGTPRPYTHSFLTMAVVLAIAALWRERRAVLLGVLFGLAVHFWRDLGESASGVALLWPFSDKGWSVPHWVYLSSLSVPLLIVGSRLARRRSIKRTSAVVGAVEV